MVFGNIRTFKTIERIISKSNKLCKVTSNKERTFTTAYLGRGWRRARRGLRVRRCQTRARCHVDRIARRGAKRLELIVHQLAFQLCVRE